MSSTRFGGSTASAYNGPIPEPKKEIKKEIEPEVAITPEIKEEPVLVFDAPFEKPKSKKKYGVKKHEREYKETN